MFHGFLGRHLTILPRLPFQLEKPYGSGTDQLIDRCRDGVDPCALLYTLITPRLRKTRNGKQNILNIFSTRRRMSSASLKSTRGKRLSAPYAEANKIQ